MDIFGIDITHIIDLTTQVATTGAMRALESGGNEVFESLINIAILVYEQNPR